MLNIIYYYINLDILSLKKLDKNKKIESNLIVAKNNAISNKKIL